MKHIKYIILILLLFCTILQTSAENYYVENNTSQANFYSSSNSSFKLNSTSQSKFLVPHQQKISTVSNEKRSDFFNNNFFKAPEISTSTNIFTNESKRNSYTESPYYTNAHFLSEIQIHAP